MNRTNSYYDFDFKLAYTCQTKTYFVKSNITINQFIDDIKMRARIDFNLQITEDIEIVEAGQYDNINGFNPELAPALQPSNVLLCEIYENIYKNITFYIRKIPSYLTIDMPTNDIENNMDMYVPRIRNQCVGYENV
jgi:hypothetical protein